MTGAILTTILVYAIVATYMTLVNRMLRTDEHWHESDMTKPIAKANTAASYPAAPIGAHA